MEIDQEIFSVVILSLPLIQEGQKNVHCTVKPLRTKPAQEKCKLTASTWIVMTGLLNSKPTQKPKTQPFISLEFELARVSFWPPAIYENSF